jgi:hypothetical protein
MCAMIWSYARARGVPIKLVNNGDDCVVMMSRKHLLTFTHGLDEWFLNMGFRMTVETPVYTLEQIEFCQMHPVQRGENWVMVRNMNTAREKDSFSILPLDNEKMFRKWIYAVGECGLSLTSGIPIFQEMYKLYVRNGMKSKIDKHPGMATGARMMAKGLESKESPVLDSTRASFFSAFGYTPDEQRAIELYYSQQVLTYGVRAVETLLEIEPAPL